MKSARLMAIATAVLACGSAYAQDKGLPALNIDPGKWIANPTVIEIQPGGETITQALKRAKPGTVINVRAGDYPGMVDLSGVHGEPDRPILLISADGPGKARLIGEPKAKEPTVAAWGVSNVGIYGFEIQCDTAEGDLGGVKIGGGWSKPAENIVVAGNLFSGQGQDACKFLNGARNIVVAANVVTGSWRQEVFDNVSVEKAVYAYNTTTDAEAYWTSLTFKGGSRDIEVLGNDLRAKTRVQLSIGGYGDFKNLKQPPYWASGFQASRIYVYNNEIGGPHSIAFAGGQDSVVENNRLQAQVSEASGGQHPERNEPSRGNTVRNNNAAITAVGAASLPADLLDLRPGGGLVNKPDRPLPAAISTP